MPLTRRSESRRRLVLVDDARLLNLGTHPRGDLSSAHGALAAADGLRSTSLRSCTARTCESRLRRELRVSVGSDFWQLHTKRSQLATHLLQLELLT